MDKRELILEAILDIGEIMLIGGAEVNRVEDTVARMAMAYGYTKADVYVIPVAIVATVRDGAGDIHTQCRRIMSTSPDLDKVEKCNALSRRICRKPMELEELRDAVKWIRRIPPFPAWVTFLAYGIMSGSFSLLFGGRAADAFCALICGLLLWLVQRACKRLYMQDMVMTLFSSMVLGMAAVTLVRLGAGQSVDKIIIGTIMPMIPGLALVTALRDMINGDLTSGVTGLLAALVRAMMIAVGFGLVLLWWSRQGYRNTAAVRNYTLIQEMLFSALPCIGASATCAVTFHVTGLKKYITLSLGGLCGYFVYLAVYEQFASPVTAIIVGTLFVMAFAEILARMIKVPIIVLLVPMLIPMIPGGDLYNTTVNLVQGHTVMANYYLRLVASEAGGMAFSIIMETSLMQLILRVGRHARMRKNGGRKKNGENGTD